MFRDTFGTVSDTRPWTTWRRPVRTEGGASVPAGELRGGTESRAGGLLTARCPTTGRGPRGAGRDGLVRLLAARGAVARCFADELLEELQVFACFRMPEDA